MVRVGGWKNFSQNGNMWIDLKFPWLKWRECPVTPVIVEQRSNLSEAQLYVSLLLRTSIVLAEKP